MCQNIKRGRAAIFQEIVNEFFDNLQGTLKDIPTSHILNYDETNLSDEPGKKKVIAKLKNCKANQKYPEHVMNFTKSSTSIMYAGFADGSLLPPYEV